ncbi:DegQ family serine endoprotease [Desulfobotulus mexicanus]|uniref:Probable periplasmic serine endoprotease DegP-like n=1 Tax=Desulfobotulus mexicanus TaxID=2586642 RepID=A0A5Q4VBG7_9BACT|nr:DegQ family serine endoprotease [Desulfobotulus mexicanus]TYT74895.1 DegQ family serine endoprotease [Desulfobotulus mexicanus]
MLPDEKRSAGRPSGRQAVFFLAGFLALFFCFFAVQSHALLRPDSFTVLAEKAGGAVVNIRTEKTTQSQDRVFRHFFESPFGENDPFEEFFRRFHGDNNPQREFRRQSLGSGFMISEDGYIVTNNHVIEGADKIRVKLKDGEEYDARIVGRDPKTDLALIRIEADKKFPYISMGDSSTLRVGEWVMAIGSPFGLEQTVTAGIVSAKGRVLGSGPYDDFIQTDASINPGNSGGPLLNLDGEVVGINTAIVSSGQGIGFAIPVNLAKGIIAQLKASGSVTRGWMGVEIQPLDPAMASYHGMKEAKGVFVVRAIEGDPAHRAGIRGGDIITRINGQQVEDTKDLILKVAAAKVGETIEVTVVRSGKEKKLGVTVARRDDAGELKKESPPEPSATEDALGLSLRVLDENMAERMGVDRDAGLLVAGVSEGSAADKAGLRRGDLIMEINHKKMDSLKAYEAVLKKAKKKERLQFLIQRRGQFLVISMDREG